MDVLKEIKEDKSIRVRFLRILAWTRIKIAFLLIDIAAFLRKQARKISQSE